jgi:N-acyl homoserine lactone hydrolase
MKVVPMTLEVKRLHLATLDVSDDGPGTPVHGFVVTHPGGAVLVDTGVGGWPEMLRDWRLVNRTAAEALADIDMVPGDIDLVINTHLHFDHCGQNAVFSHAKIYVQRGELDRCQREARDIYDWFGFMNAGFELLDGDAEIVPGLSVITTPGHTSGHQSVLVEAADGSQDLLAGDAAYTPDQYADADLAEGELPPGQAHDVPSWRESVRRMHAISPARVHFCHYTPVLHG